MIAFVVALSILDGAMVFGGLDSCATWQSSASTREAGRNWVLGYWSGMNMALAKPGGDNGQVGRSTDPAGIVGEVELVCRASPSKTLIAATDETFERFRAEGR